MLTLPIVTTACAPMSSSQDQITETSVGHPNVDQPGTEIYKPTPLLWEASQKDGVLWSAFAYQIIGSDVADILLPGSTDIKQFCSNYDGMTNSERVNFWAYLISAMAKFESGFNPLSRYAETTLGTDAITRLPLYSEGLLQLSYQDVQQYSFCQFDWQADKTLAAKDPKKSILDPFKNLDCGIKIMADQIRRKRSITLSSGVYWAVIKINGKYTKIKEISALTQSLPFCKL